MDRILELYRHPKHRGRLAVVTHGAELQGKVCGDRLVLEVFVKDGQIEAASFSGECCAVTTAAASTLLERVIGKSIAQAMAVETQQVIADLQGDIPKGRWECIDLPRQALVASLQSQ